MREISRHPVSLYLVLWVVFSLLTSGDAHCPACWYSLAFRPAQPLSCACRATWILVALNYLWLLCWGDIVIASAAGNRVDGPVSHALKLHRPLPSCTFSL